MARQSRVKRILVISTGVILGLFVLFIILGLTLPEPESTPESAQRSTPESASATMPPESEPESTDVPPTFTLEATAAPTPESTPECPNAEELAYFQEVSAVVNVVAGIARDFSELNFELSENLSEYPPPPWMEKAGAIMNRFEALADRIEGVEAPESVEKVHDDLLDAAESLRSIPGIYSRGVATQDGNLINDAIDEWDDMTDSVRSATERSLEFCD